MPYIVAMHPADDRSYATRAEQIAAVSLTRRAVATLDSACEVALDLAITQYVEPDMRPSWANACRRLPVEGGTVGPLPDGTVIDVAYVGWATLERATDPGLSRDAILAAYNAAQR